MRSDNFLTDEDIPATRKANGHKRSAPLLENLPTHSEEAERGLLGCIFLEPMATVGVCVERLLGGLDTFHDERHRLAYGAILDLFHTGTPIDLVTVHQRLRDKNQVVSGATFSYLSGLIDATPSSAMLEHYIAILLEKHTLRRIEAVCRETILKMQTFQGDYRELLDGVEKSLMAITTVKSVAEMRQPKQVVCDVLAKVEAQMGSGTELAGLSSGFQDLDALTGGFQPSEVTVIAARPTCGKTSMALNIADHIASTVPVGFISLEMPADQLMVRQLSFRAQVDSRNISRGTLNSEEQVRIKNAAAKISRLPLFVDDEGGITVLQLRAKCRRMYQQLGVRFFVIDYLQLVRSSSGRGRGMRSEEVADVSNGIKSLAKELKVPFLVLSQMNRESTKDNGRRPRLDDLRESGAIEQDADLVGFLYNKKDDNETGGLAMIEFLLDKHRNGPTGSFQLKFVKSLTKMECVARIEPEDIPWDTDPVSPPIKIIPPPTGYREPYAD